MSYLLAFLPILSVLILMLFFHRNSQEAGSTGWVIGIGIALFSFGLNWNVFWVSQVKSLLLSLNVLLVLWPALLLYNLVDQIGGVKAIARWLGDMINDRGLLLLVLAWIFSSVVEGVAGFGLPIAIVGPMLVVLGVPSLAAIVSVALGHAWAVTFGNMGIVYQTLLSLSNIDSSVLAPITALLLGFTCLACGLSSAFVLRQIRLWPFVLLLSCCMALVQYFCAATALASIGSFSASVVGILLCILISRVFFSNTSKTAGSVALRGAAIAYGSVIVLMVITNLIPSIHGFLAQTIWQINFPEVQTQTGMITPPGPGQIFRPWLHPGTVIIVSCLISYIIFRKNKYLEANDWKVVIGKTYKAAASSSISVICMVGLSSLMEHTGMTMLLAQGLSQVMGSAFPLVSPLVGMLGAFATGSNNNSNVLFTSLQKGIASILGIGPAFLVAAQTTGGSLGSMIAPAKIAVGYSTMGSKDESGKVLRYTLPIGLFIGICVGLITWLLVNFSK